MLTDNQLLVYRKSSLTKTAKAADISISKGNICHELNRECHGNLKKINQTQQILFTVNVLLPMRFTATVKKR